jgi:hypothetical protein
MIEEPRNDHATPSLIVPGRGRDAKVSLEPEPECAIGETKLGGLVGLRECDCRSLSLEDLTAERPRKPFIGGVLGKAAERMSGNI